MLKKIKFSQYAYVLVFLVILAIYAITNNGLSWSVTTNIFRHSAVVGIIGIGMGIVVLTGDIDLSVGSMLAMIAGFAVIVFNVTDNIFLTLIFVLFFGALLGLVNGLLVGYVGMPAFIVTLATMLIYRSLSQYICQKVDKALIGNGSSVYKMVSDQPHYQALYDFGNGKFLTIPIVGLVLVAVTALFVYITTGTKFGKKIYAIGSNANAAAMTGINVKLNRVLVYVIAGMLVGLSAFMWIAMKGSCDPATTGKSYEMYAIAAVVLGGISMSGGRGRTLGILFGAMSYTVIDKVIVALKMDSLINDAIKGAILIIVILLQFMAPAVKDKFRSKK